MGLVHDVLAGDLDESVRRIRSFLPLELEVEVFTRVPKVQESQEHEISGIGDYDRWRLEVCTFLFSYYTNQVDS